MDRFIVLFVSVVSLVKADEIEKCMEATKAGRHCCKFDISEERKAIMKECFEKTGDRVCDFEVCYGEKRGIMSNGKINKTAFTNMIKHDFANYTGVADVLIKKCLPDNQDFYNQEDACHLKEIGFCLGFYSMVNCPKWKDSDDCKKVKTLIGDCKSVVP